MAMIVEAASQRLRSVPPAAETHFNSPQNRKKSTHWMTRRVFLDSLMTFEERHLPVISSSPEIEMSWNEARRVLGCAVFGARVGVVIVFTDGTLTAP